MQKLLNFAQLAANLLQHPAQRRNLDGERWLGQSPALPILQRCYCMPGSRTLWRVFHVDQWIED